MKVGDLVRIKKDNWATSSKYKGRWGRLAIVVDGDPKWADANRETRVYRFRDGAILRFLTKELEVV
jgi:hypothetical protein